jgi:uncharacterized phiE125 gp8 family phage protein
MQIQCLEKSSSAPLGVEDIKMYLRLEGNHDDTLLKDLISSALERLENKLSCALLTSLFEQRFFKKQAPFQYPFIKRFPLKEEGFVLGRFPFQSVEKIEIKQGSLKRELKQSEYTLKINQGRGKFYLKAPLLYDEISVQFKAGFADKPEDIPADLKQALRLFVTFFYENRGDTSLSFDDRVLHTFIKPYLRYGL